MDVLTYKTLSASEPLNESVIDNNLKETDKISDPRYIMSAGTSWLRKNHNKTLLDLQQHLQTLQLRTIILSENHNNSKPSSYDLCIPGNEHVKLQYVANFVSNPHLLANIKPQTSEDLEKLKYTGYSCSRKYSSRVAAITMPPIEDLCKQDIHIQLQWAVVSFRVEHIIVNPDEMLQKDLESATDKYHEAPTKIPIIYKEKEKERIYAYVNSKKEYISEFGILEKTTDDGGATSYLVVHLPTYLYE